MSPLCVEQLKALFVKDWLIRRRHWVATLFELFLPIMLTLILLKSLSSPPDKNSSKETNLLRQMNAGLPSEFHYSCFLLGQSIIFTPPTPEIAFFMKNISDLCFISVESFVEAPDEASLIDQFNSRTAPDDPIGVAFHYFNTIERKANYTMFLRNIDYRERWDSRPHAIYDRFPMQTAINLLMSTYPLINSSFFDFTHTRELLPNNIPKKSDTPHDDSGSIDRIHFYLTYFFLEIGSLFMVAIMIRRIVNEKSTNSREFLRIMGMSDSVYWLSHFLNYFTIFIFHATIITFLFIFFTDTFPLGNWTPSLFFISYLMTSISLILSTFALSTIINKPVIAVLVSIVQRAVFSYAPVNANSTFLMVSTKTWSCLLSDGGFYWSLNSLALLGSSGKSAWKHMFSPNKHSLPLGYIFLLIIISWFAYGFLTWYLDAVFPWQPGIRKPWYFICQRYLTKKTDETKTIDLEARSHSGIHESMAFQSEASIRCINIHKTFGSFGSRINVVNGINLQIMKGQITCLLGHNGAGKTTTMNMITGILPPSSGTILINGIDISKHVIAARQALALCPQTSLLFEELTVSENLYLCAGLRGLSKLVKRQLVPLNISRVNLESKVDTLARNLSGGMKRRLQLALALTTSSEILILDEPTSGLDPESRRQIWNLLLELRKNLTILLTTHFMEEADALGDRIVIMDSGQIKCSGSPMFLKNKLGAGYLIRIAKNQNTFNLDKVEALIKSIFPTSTLIGNTNEEITYRLENADSNEISSISLPNLCDCLDEMKETLGILTYGIDVSTLEDVFLRVCMTDKHSNPNANLTVNAEDSMFNLENILSYKTLTGCALTFQRLKGLIYKRFHYAKRHKKVLLFTFILPILAIYYTFSSTRSAAWYVANYNENTFDSIEINPREIYGDVKAIILTDTPDNLKPLAKTYIDINREMNIETKIINSSYSNFQDYLTQNNEDESTFMRKYLFGLIDIGGKIKLWHNPQAVVSLQISLDAYTNSILRLQSGLKSSRVTTIFKNIPEKVFINASFIKITVLAIMSVFIPFGVCFIAASYFLFPSTEFHSKTALIQRMSGIESLLFWTSNYLFDMIYHTIVSVLILGAICYVDPFILGNFKFFVSIFSLLLLYGFASIPLAYFLSYLPISSEGGFAFIVVFSLIISCVGSVSLFLYTFLFKGNLVKVILGFLFPPFTVTTALAALYAKVILYRHCENIGKCKVISLKEPDNCCIEREFVKFSNPLEKEEGVYYHLIILSIAPFIYFFLLILFDLNLNRLGYWYDTLIYYILPKKLHPVSNDVDGDVAIERDRVNSLLRKANYPDSMIVHDLTKDFRNFRAVDHLSFSVRQKECFGLLGVNGAGKTTTFRMLTGDILVTSGDAFIRKISLRNNLVKFQQSISYCPQYDALLSNLNPRETLALFARLRGMPEHKVRDNVDYLIKSLDLGRFATTLNCNLSGGNKRKLSLAIASIAKPELMFLDEPTTGVDPSARRKIWSSLIYLRDCSGSSIVLTSHSMDECEALCSRIAIMARGKLRCLGSAQYLKEKFGQGFSLLIKLNHEAIQDSAKVDQISNFIMESFPSAKLRDHHQTILHYHITDTSSRWGAMLRKMEEAKSKLPINDYTLTGTTLEQVFLSFAKKT